MWRKLIVSLALPVLLGACSEGSESGVETLSTLDAASITPVLEVEVIEQFPHDPSSFTQGLLLDGPTMYESIGRYGSSALIELQEPELAPDGQPSSGYTAERRTPVDEEYFAEGLALVDDRLVQLTWKAGTAFVYDIETLEVIDEYSYEGEGWGLCLQTGRGSDADRLVMSNGSDMLTFRDPDTFEELGDVDVTLDGVALASLNELECVDGTIYANVWQSTDIAVIDAETGEVTALIDAGHLAAENSGDVLNGIAYDEASDTFLITGKLWPNMYRVRFVE